MKVLVIGLGGTGLAVCKFLKPAECIDHLFLPEPENLMQYDFSTLNTLSDALLKGQLIEADDCSRQLSKRLLMIVTIRGVHAAKTRVFIHRTDVDTISHGDIWTGLLIGDTMALFAGQARSTRDADDFETELDEALESELRKRITRGVHRFPGSVERYGDHNAWPLDLADGREITQAVHGDLKSSDICIVGGGMSCGWLDFDKFMKGASTNERLVTETGDALCVDWDHHVLSDPPSFQRRTLPESPKVSLTSGYGMVFVGQGERTTGETIIENQATEIFTAAYESLGGALEPAHRTTECLSLFRWEAAFKSGLKPEERNHLENCPHCATMATLFASQPEGSHGSRGDGEGADLQTKADTPRRASRPLTN